MLKPKFKFNRITDISFEFLLKNNIEALILDVDNTLSTHHGEELVDGLERWLEYMNEKGIKLIILSNSKKSRVEPFAKKISLDYIPLGLKPLPFGYIKALRLLKSKRNNTAIVGDQIFTDVIGGNTVGVKTILLTPILLETGWSFKLRRRLEKILYKIYKLD